MNWFKKLFAPVPLPIPQLSPEEELEVQLQSKVQFEKKDDPMTLEDATKIALEISASFEGHNGFSEISGNWDGQGLSAGALQWAWKQGTQQKLVLKCPPGVIDQYMPTQGKRYKYYASKPISQTESEIASWSKGAKVLEPYCSELKALWGSPEMIEVQVYFGNSIAKKADRYARDWISKTGTEYTIQEFCFFFDVIVNNGSLLGLTHDDVSERMNANGRDKVFEEILEWCEIQTNRDAVKNGALWKGLGNINQVDLLCLGWLRSLKAKHEYQASVMNRRGTLALGIGYCDADKKDLNSKYLGTWPSSLIS